MRIVAAVVFLASERVPNCSEQLSGKNTKTPENLERACDQAREFSTNSVFGFCIVFTYFTYLT